MLPSELISLAQWLAKHYTANNSAFENVVSTLQHNATQASKQPVTPLIEALEEVISGWPIYELSSAQRELLRKNNASTFIGTEGKDFLRRMLQTENFDPAQASTLMRAAWKAMTSFTNQMNELSGKLVQFHITESDPTVEFHDQVLTRIHFQDGASIKNMVTFEKAGNDWLLIVQALSDAVGEAPETTEVVGASKGSLILWLVMTVGVAGALAALIKHGCKATLNIVEAQSAIEQLRHTKVMNNVVEDALKEELKKLKNSQIDGVLEGMTTEVKGLSAEKKAKLKKAIERYMEFSKVGGTVELIASSPEELDKETDGDLVEHLNKLQSSIAEARKLSEQLTPLLSHANDDESPDKREA